MGLIVFLVYAYDCQVANECINFEQLGSFCYLVQVIIFSGV